MHDTKLTMYDTNSCCIQEIAGLKVYAGKPEEAMKAFCKLNLKPTGVKYHGFTARAKTLYTFYYFTAAVKKQKGDDNYGTQFAKFIRDNKLGVLTPSPVKKNYGFHSDHFNQVWLWHPNLSALQKWSDEHAVGVSTPPAPNVEVAPPKPIGSFYGKWDVVNGLAGQQCLGCGSTYVKGEPVWPDAQLGYMCEACGKARGH